MVEVALLMPFLLVFALACLQFAVVFMAYLNVIQVTRDAGRWVSVHPHTIDTDTVALIRGRLPQGINPSLLPTPALTLAFTPACTSLVNGRCASRPTGHDISVRATYKLASHLFLPTTFGFGRLIVRLPLDDLNYTIFMQVEPG